MIDKLNKEIKKKVEKLPILSYYWEIGGTQIKRKEEVVNVSKFYNTQKMPLHGLYKPISTNLNLNELFK